MLSVSEERQNLVHVCMFWTQLRRISKKKNKIKKNKIYKQ